MSTIKELQQRYALASGYQNVELLLAESIKKDTTWLHTHPEYHPNIRDYLRFRWWLFRYRRGYSVAAVVGHKEFFGLDFLVNRHTLIPRPETELMVEAAIATLTTTPYSLHPTLLIDAGTGSGCIPISILKTNPVQPVTAFAIDISKKALRVAKKNAARHGVKIQFLLGNLLQPALKIFNLQSSIFNSLIITANLPYLTREQIASEPSIQREPATALVAEDGGLALYGELFEQIKTLPSQPITILCEIDPSQSDRMSGLAKKFFPTANVEIKKDLSGLNRLAVIKLS